eukprot:gene17303-biopygen5328
MEGGGTATSSTLCRHRVRHRWEGPPTRGPCSLVALRCYAHATDLPLGRCWMPCEYQPLAVNINNRGGVARSGSGARGWYHNARFWMFRDTVRRNVAMGLGSSGGVRAVVLGDWELSWSEGFSWRANGAAKWPARAPRRRGSAPAASVPDARAPARRGSAGWSIRDGGVGGYVATAPGNSETSTPTFRYFR